MTLDTRPLQPNLGTEILDVDLAAIDDDTFEAIRTIWQNDPVVLFRRQSLTEQELVSFSKRFGTLDLDTIKTVTVDDPAAEDRNPELFYVSNLLYQDGAKVGGLSNDEIVWHTDLIFRARPASGSIFYGVETARRKHRTAIWRTLTGHCRKT